MIQAFSADNFQSLCDGIAKEDKHFAIIIKKYGYPPMWNRPPGFPTLIHIILEQQVSLASAKAAFDRVTKKLRKITPAALLSLSDAEMRDCYFSRQKTIYARHLADMIGSGKLKLQGLEAIPDEEIRLQLKQVKGIGDWTVDVYLLFALQRADIFPTGDLAMIKALKDVKELPEKISKDEILMLAERWRPHRSIVTMLLWHHYLEKKREVFKPTIVL